MCNSVARKFNAVHLMQCSLMFLIFICQDNNAIQQNYVFDHRRFRDLGSAIVKHLVRLNFISQVFCHFLCLSRSFWRREVSLSDLISEYNRQSSANRRTFEVRLQGRLYL